MTDPETQQVVDALAGTPPMPFAKWPHVLEIWSSLVQIPGREAVARHWLETRGQRLLKVYRGSLATCSIRVADALGDIARGFNDVLYVSSLSTVARRRLHIGDTTPPRNSLAIVVRRATSGKYGKSKAIRVIRLTSVYLVEPDLL